jgi:hypothetical protein
VIVFPLISTILSAMCALVLLKDQRSRPRPDKLVWAIAFTMFALAAGADAAGRTFGWTEELARLYYATGPALVVMFLAIGELYLLFPKHMGHFAPGATLLLTAGWVTTVLNAPIDQARLEEDGWEAIDRGAAMVAMTITINSVGTLIIVGGLGFSIWRFWRSGTHRQRMIGCALIAIGTIVVGLGGTLTRLGHYEYLYIAMSVGIALIFLGVLSTRRPDPIARAQAVRPARGEVSTLVPTSPNGSSPSAALAIQETNALGFVGQQLLTLDDAALDRFCTEWSVPRDDNPVFAREEARRAWAFRRSLSDDARARFDTIPVPARRQIVVLFDEVLAPADGDDSGISVIR